MNKEKLQEIARRELSNLSGKSGGILYTSHENLRPGPIYLLGFNPGGEGGPSLGSNIEEMLDYTENSYTDEAYTNRAVASGSGEAVLQKRVRRLLASIGWESGEVCASNLIFVQSRDATGIERRLVDQCWPVHEAILDLVRPKLIIAFGNGEKDSTYAYLRNLLEGQEEHPSPRQAGHGNWSLKGWKTHWRGQPMYVAGIPHMSRYEPAKAPSIPAWLKSKL